MAGSSPAMTTGDRASSAPELLGKHLLQDLPLDVAVVSEASCHHQPSRFIFSVAATNGRHFAEIRVGVSSG